jgi:hypothetical protein
MILPRRFSLLFPWENHVAAAAPALVLVVVVGVVGGDGCEETLKVILRAEAIAFVVDKEVPLWPSRGSTRCRRGE